MMFQKASSSKQTPEPRAAEPPVATPVQPTPARLGLQLAIARKDKARAELAVITEGAAIYQEKRLGGYRALAAAEARLAEAVTAQADYAIKATFGTAGAPPLTTKEARDEVAEAKDNLAIILETVAKLDAAREEWQSHLRTYDQHISEARQAVIASDPTIEKLLVRVWELHAEFIEGQAVLAFLGLSRKLPQNYNHKVPDDSAWREFYGALLSNAEAVPPN